MTLTIVPSKRTQLIDRYNHVPYAKVASTQGTALGPLGAVVYGSTSLYYSTATPLIGGTCGQLVLNTAGTNQGAKLLEATLPALQLGTSTTYTVSLYVNSPAGAPNPILLINGTGAGSNTYSTASAVKGSWVRIQATFTTTAVTNGLVSVYLMFDAAGFQNTYTLFDALQIDDGASPVPWFDGSGPLVPDSTWLYGWVGTAGASLSKRYVLDPGEVANPALVLGWSSAKTSGVIVHTTLANNVVATLKKATLSTGNARFFFLDRAAAYRLYSLLDRPDTFTYTDTDNPETNCTFVAAGRIGVTLDDATRKRWIVDVDFQQVA